ncbi:MAG TPA: phenylacetic acid degradation operon negative regulatory protein PaaX [Woeseiaceae bacterium]|nr:phenylacetic acid degradation operon negative regulatory protein PaaX [Woeseiaceae bacterium]
MSLESTCRDLVAGYQSRPTIRAGSLITTVFGDSIAPRGGTVWLGSLIKALHDFGINERLVRTSVYRLVRDGWLEAEQLGRRSYYSLTEEGREKFAQATHRIYGEPTHDWNGEWCLVLLTGLDTRNRELVRKEISWLGFAAMSPNVMAHPKPDLGDLDVVLRRLHLSDEVVVMEGRTIRSEAALRSLAQSGWNIADIDERYATFVQSFHPVYRETQKAKSIGAKTAFLLRSLLIQEYRKVLLRDPHLPVELLPASWHGTAAYQLCRNVYRQLYAPAELYLSEVMENVNGPLPPAAKSSAARFGGLSD